MFGSVASQPAGALMEGHWFDVKEGTMQGVASVDNASKLKYCANVSLQNQLD